MKISVFKNFFIALCLSFVVGNFAAHAATKYWIGPADGGFGNDAYWSTTPGGPNDTTAPGSGDVATFTSDVNTDCVIPGSNIIAQLVTNAGYTSTLKASSGTNFQQTITLNDGVLLGGGGTLGVSSVNLLGGDFVTGVTDVTFGTNAELFIDSASSTFDATEVEFDTSFNSVSIDADVGTFEMPSATMKLEGFWTMDPGFVTNHNNGTLRLDGDDDGSFQHNEAGVTTLELFNLIIEKTNSTDAILMDTGNAFNLEVEESLVLTNGLLNGGGSGATVISSIIAEKDLTWQDTFDGGTGV